MGLIKDTLSKGIQIFNEEIVPLRYDLQKSGVLKPDKQAFDQKANLVDPWAYGQTGYGYKERYALLDYDKLRAITYADPIVAAVMQTRLNQVASYARPQPDKYKVGFKIKLRESDKEPSDADLKRMKEISQFLMNGGVPESFEDTPEIRRRDNFETFLRKITRDSLTFDQINFEVIPRKDGRPYGFQAVDAGTIRIIPDKKEEVDSGNPQNAQKWIQSVEHNEATSKYFNEFKPKHPSYAQVIQGSVRHTFDEWEMAFGVRNPRTDLRSYGYGFSEIEMLITTITSHMNAETYNRKFFTQGSTIKGVLAFEGQVPPDQLEAFRRQWYQQATAVNNAWRTPIMALGKEGKLNWQSLHANNRDMEFGSWMDYTIKSICSVFQMDPLEIGFDISKQGSGEGGGSSGGLGNGNQGERVAFSQDKGLRPLLIHIQTLINDYIVYRLDPNFEFEFVGLNVGSQKDELDQAISQGKAFKTIDEIRAEQDLPPMPKMDKIKDPGQLILDTNLIQFINSQQGMQQEEELQAQGGEGFPGEEGVEPGGEAPGGEAPEEEVEEPKDYENMSLEELEAEYARLGGESEQDSTDMASSQKNDASNESDSTDMAKKQRKLKKSVPGFVKSFFKELEL